jgi:hypothetical protein
MLLALLATLSPGHDRLLAQGESLFRAGDLALGLVIVRRGVLELRRLSPEGRLSILHRAGPGDTFAEACLFETHHHCDAVAATPGLVRGVRAVAVCGIGQDLDHPAFGDGAMRTSCHAREFRFQRAQPRQPFAHRSEVPARDVVRARALRIGRRVREAQQLADVVHREAQLPRVADETEPVEMRAGIDTVTAFGPRGRRQQALGFVEADGGGLHPGRSGEVADGEALRHGWPFACRARNCAKAVSVFSLAWCSNPSASSSAVSGSRPTAIRKRTTRSCRAFGNVADRLRIGAVVDFIDAHYGGWHWPTFNMADVAIVCGVAALIMASLRPAPTSSEQTGSQER